MNRTLTVLFIAAAVLLYSQVWADDAPEYRFLLERVKVSTDSGIVAFPAGMRVMIVSEKDGKVVVKSGDRQFEVESVQLTKNPEAAQKVVDKEAATKKERDKERKKDEQDAALAAAIAHPSGGGTPGDKLRALEKQATVVHGEMERVFSEMMSTPKKLKPRTPDEHANNEKHDELKKKHEELQAQYSKIMEEERLLRHETR